MRTQIYLLLLTLLSATSFSFGQSMLANKYLDTAVAYQRTVKNYTKALKYYELAIKNGNDGNYTYYNAAQCACQTGETEKAITYYKKGFAVYMDYGNYETFATDTLIKCFSNTPEWKGYLALMKTKYDSLNAVINNYKLNMRDTTKRLNYSLISDSLNIAPIFNKKTTSEVISWIKNYNNFSSPPIKNHGTIYNIKVNDTLSVPFFVYVPEAYDPRKKNKLYIFLHGGVGLRPNFQTAPMLFEDDQKVLKKPIDNDCVILYPLAKKGFNWLYNQIAFETIIKEVSFIKSLYNIDDNKVYMGGHSDGGTGTFWVATHKSHFFASFLGLNYNPRAYFGNTNLSNLQNDGKFFGISGTDDGTFNINSVNNIKNYGVSIGDNWHGFIINGGDHSIPYDNPNATYFAYDSLFMQVRNPFPKQIRWETDNVSNGRYYWLEINKLDTLAEKADWQKIYNPPAIIINGKSVNYNFNAHKSGAIIASINDNVITIQQSRVKELTFYASPELVDLNKPVKIYLNGKLVYNAKIKEDKKVIADEFIKTKDRSIIVINKIRIAI